MKAQKEMSVFKSSNRQFLTYDEWNHPIWMLRFAGNFAGL
jgi:hypothetical protein